MKKLKYLLGLLMLIAPAVFGQGSATANLSITVNPSSGGFATGWTSLTGTGWAPLCPNAGGGRPDIQGQTGCAAVVDAWSGGAADTVNNHLYFWGGGHHDYCGNEIYDLNLNTLAIGLADVASTFSGSCSTSADIETLGDGTPSARHGYGGLTFDPTAKKFMSFGGGITGNGSLTNAIWAVTVATLSPSQTGGTSGTNSWANLSPTISGGSLQNEFGNMTGYDPNTDSVWMMEPSKFPGNLWQYNRGTNTLVNKAVYNGGTVVNANMSGAVDVKRQVFYMIGGNDFLKVSIASGSAFTIQSVGGTNCSAALSGGYPGIDFDYSDNTMVIWQGGNTVYSYNPDTNTCTAETYSNGPTTVGQNGTFGRFRYFPTLGIFAVCNAKSENCFVLKRGVDFAMTNSWSNRIAGVGTPGGAANIVSSLDLNTFPTTTIQHYIASSFGNGSITNDTTVHTSDGTGSLHWHMNAGAFQGEPGTYNYNFNSTNTALYGQNSEFYVQLRVRYDAALVDPTTWTSFEGSKIFFISEGDSSTSGQTGGCSNTPTDTVIQNGSSGTFGFPINYWNCGVAGTLRFLDSGFEPVQLFGPSLPGPSGNFLDQVATGCPHYTGFAGMPSTDPPCWNFTANEFFTIQMRVKWVGNNTANSTQDLYFAHQSQPARLINNAVDMAIRDLGGATTDKFGKITLGPYATNATWVKAANVWYCCIIVSNRRVPDPDVNTPQPPDNLSLSSVSSSSVTVNWRVNSNNVTPQDDIGFIVERCTNTTPQCLGNQSPWTQVGTITAPHATSLVDNTVSAGHTYVYRVKARNNYGDSGYANSICFNTSGTCGGTAVL